MLRVSARTLLILGPLALYACNSSPPVLPPQVVLDSITIEPEAAMVVVDETLRMTATGNYSDGTTEDLTVQARWASADREIASVSTNGLLRGRSLGSVEITVTFEEVESKVTVTVVPSPLRSIALDPTTLMLQVGETQAILATGTLEDDTQMDVTEALTWSSSDASIATVAAGAVTAVSAGTATVTASDPATGVEATARVTVAQPLPESLALTPDGGTLPIGQTLQLTATITFMDGTDVDVTSAVMWRSSRDSVAVVNNEGLVTTVSEGITSITALHSSGLERSVSVRVTPPTLTTLTVTPTTATLGLGETVALSVEGILSNGTRMDMTNQVEWSSTDEAVATISNMPGDQGTARTVGPGTTTISARDPISNVRSDDTGGSAQITVTPATLQSIAIVPLQVSVPLGATEQLTAIGLYSDNSNQDISSQVDWSSTVPTVATVSATGLVSPLLVGFTTVVAVDPVTGISSSDSGLSSEVEVLPPALLSIEVTPPIAALVLGATQQMTATGSFSDGQQRNITGAVDWVADGAAISIGAGGLAMAQGLGTVNVSAVDNTTGISSDATNQSATLTVSAANLLSIAVTPTATTAPVGAGLTFVATGFYDNNSSADISQVVNWTSSNTAVATVDNTPGQRGKTQTLIAGQTTVSATEPSSGISSDASAQSATLTVDGAIALTALSVSPDPATVDVGDDLPMSARGTFTNGSNFDMTESVQWSSANGVASISNADGSRGVVTGINVGPTTITAMHAPSNVSATAQLTVTPGIVTLTQTWPGPTVTVDGSGAFGVDVGTVDFNLANFPVGAVITDVDVSINFLKTDGSCAAPGTGNAFHDETSFRIQSPTGAQVVLAVGGTWSGATAIMPVDVIFDQAGAAVPSGIPASGTFQPTGDLGTLNGLAPAGTWTLQAGDSGGGDPLCVNSFTVTVTAQ